MLKLIIYCLYTAKGVFNVMATIPKLYILIDWIVRKVQMYLFQRL